MREFIKFVLRGILAVSVSLIVVVGGMYIHLEHFSSIDRDKRVQLMYKTLLAKSGQAQNGLPLYIEVSTEENAYNDGKQVVIYTGLLDSLNDDEIALVLGHEIAHGMLEHLGKLQATSAEESAVHEANADKLGAVYALKAGYDVCKGREVFKHWENERGNALGQTHPDYAYRYSELNINCGE
jgi:predicted Zn-dependent protease